jgi:hypothetical protein
MVKSKAAKLRAREKRKVKRLVKRAVTGRGDYLMPDDNTFGVGSTT